MELEWDPAKRESNLTKHGLDFTDADLLFEGPVVARQDSRKDYGEERWQGVGVLQGRVVVAIWTDRPPNRRRIISLRRASEHERQAYWEAIKDRLGEGRFD